MARAAVIVAALVLAAAAASAQIPDTPNKFYGFDLPRAFPNYWNYTVDIREMQSLMDAGDFTTAIDIFYRGKNNARNATVLRNMGDFTVRDLSAEGPDSWYGIYTAAYGLNYLATMITPYVNGSEAGACCGVRNAALGVLFRTWQAAYAFHEVDSGIAEGAADEAGHGFAVVGSPYDRAANYWAWANGNSRASCIRAVTDPVTRRSAPPVNIAMRDAYAALGPAIAEEDIDRRAQLIAEGRAQLARTAITQFLQAVLVNARMAANPMPENVIDCLSSCYAEAKQAAATIALRSIAPLVLKYAPTASGAIADLLASLAAPEPRAAFKAVRADAKTIAEAVGLDYRAQVYACGRP